MMNETEKENDLQLLKPPFNLDRKVISVRFVRNLSSKFIPSNYSEL